MPFNDARDDRQTEARAALRPAGVAALERLLHALGIDDAGPMILDGQLGLPRATIVPVRVITTTPGRQRAIRRRNSGEFERSRRAWLLLFFLGRRLFFGAALFRHVGSVRSLVGLNVFESSLRISNCI